jgi:predicted permease
MRLLRNLFRRVRGLVRSETIHREIDEEARFHIEMRTDENIRRGMSSEEARRDAERRFGNLIRIKERGYEVRGGRWLETLGQDLRYGARMLLKNPGFTLVVVLTLALGIGANTAIFSFINALLFKPLRGVTEPGGLAQVVRTYEGRGFSEFSYPDYRDYRDYNTVISGLAVKAGGSFNLNDGRGAERVEGELVSGNFFEVLGVRPERGRLLAPADDSAGVGDPVVVISHGLWRRRFDANPDVSGKTVKLNGYDYTIVGVADEEFEGIRAGSKMDLWIPITTLRLTSGSVLDERGPSLFEIFGRLKPGVTIERANAEFSTIARQLEQAYPDTNDKDGARVYPDLGMDPEVRMILRRFSFIPLTAVGIVLLIACANVAGLLLARSNARRKEIGMRLVVGASRTRIVRQLLTESLMLALLGGAFGILIGIWMTRGLISVLPNDFRDISFKFDFGIDWRVFAFTLIASTMTGVLIGLIPALQASRADLVSALKDARSAGEWRAGFRGALVVTQVALSFVLLIAAGLCVRTLRNAHALDLGYEIEHLLTARIDLPQPEYNEARGQLFQRRLVERLEALPGVQSVSLASRLPLNDGRGQTGMFPKRDGRRVDTYVLDVSHHYLETMKTPLLSGRRFNESDDAGAPRVAIINETLQRHAWHNENPIGKRFSMGFPSDGGAIEVVGVARDTKLRDLFEPASPIVYLPLLQNYRAGTALLLRSTIEPEQLAAAVRREARALDPNLPVYRVTTLADHFTAVLTPQRMLTNLVSGFGLLALALAGAGLFGSLAYSVEQRRQEIGVRIALGAQSRDVLALIILSGMKLTLLGLAIGLPASYGLTKLMKNYLYGVSLTDPLTFVVISVTLLVVALLACYAPARRAVGIDPLQALRHE